MLVNTRGGTATDGWNAGLVLNVDFQHAGRRPSQPCNFNYLPRVSLPPSSRSGNGGPVRALRMCRFCATCEVRSIEV